MTVEINTSQVLEALNHLQQRATPQGMASAFHEIGETLQNEIQANLGRGVSPWGVPFFPLLKPRKRQGGGIGGDIPLNDTRKHIHDKIAFNADGNGVDVGILDGAGIGVFHQFGSLEERNVPARPFMPIVGDNVEMPAEWNQRLMGVIFRHFGGVP